MAISRYWRIVGIRTIGNGALELSEARIYENGALVDAGATLTATLAPGSGAAADLRDGLTTGVVSWARADYTSPGFALVWDFGAGLGASEIGVKLGSGSSSAGFASAFVVQSSSDGVYWGDGHPHNLLYPGDYALSVVSSTVDLYYNNVALHLTCNGVDGATTFIDQSPFPASVVATAGAAVTTAQSKFGGASLQITTKNGKLDITKSEAVNLTGTYTIEVWGRTTATVVGDAHNVLTTNDNGSPNRFVVDWYAPTSTTIVGRVAGPSNNPIYTSPSKPYVLGTWAHIAYVNNVKDSTFKIFINGELAGSRALVALFNATAFQVAKNSSSWAEPPYQLDDLRITQGVALYTVNFTPPAAQFLMGQSLQAPTYTLADGTYRYLPAGDLPSAGVQGHSREHTFFDAYNGGIGNVYGTVKEKSTPSDVPLRRRVLLIDERSQMTIRETWSDAVTGNYEFSGVKQGVPYTVLSYDHTGAYRAVVADGQIPELIA